MATAMRRAGLLVFLAALGCGNAGASLQLTLYTPVAAEQDPFEGVRQLRVLVSAPGLSTMPQLFDVSSGSARLSGLPLTRFVSVIVEGLSGVDAKPLARGYAPPVDLVGGAHLQLPAFFAKVDRFAGNVSVSSGLRADLHDARAGHAAALLKDGRVLISGGAVLSAQGAIVSPLTRVEIYDPMTGESAPGGDMAFPRAFHTATLLKDGRVLIAGGMSLIGGNFSPLATAELFDPVAGRFSAPLALVESRGRASHTATLLPDGRVLLAGGWGLSTTGDRPVLATAELFNPTDSSFKDAGPMQAPRSSHTATLLFDERVFLAGGRDDAGGRGDSELFDAHNGGPFTAGPALPDGVARAGHAAVRLASGAVLVAGGCSAPALLSSSLSAATASGCHATTAAVSTAQKRVDVFDPGSTRFLPGVAPALQIERTDLSATLLPGDTGVAFAGGLRMDGSVAVQGEVIEQASSGALTRRTTAGDVRRPRVFHAAVRLGSGLLLLSGGSSRDIPASPFTVLPDLEVYVP
jgi:hypothetical protein